MRYAEIKFLIFVFTLSPALQVPAPNVINKTWNQAGSSRNSQRLTRLTRNVIADLSDGVVKYYLDGNYYDSIIAVKVRTAMDIIEGSSCLRFHKSSGPLTKTQSPWIHLTNPTKEKNCVHQPQHNENGEIVLVLGYNCLNMAQILHTILHAVGFKDEVRNSLRDKYIRVQWHNIQPAYRELFGQTHSKLDDLVEYDPQSVMHFSDHDYSINGQATIEPVPPGMIISPSDTLSQLDKMKLKAYFNHMCNNREVDSILKTCKESLHPDRSAKKKEKLVKLSYKHYRPVSAETEERNKQSERIKRKEEYYDEAYQKASKEEGNRRKLDTSEDETRDDSEDRDEDEEKHNPRGRSKRKPDRSEDESEDELKDKERK